jgi:hypothetical protein
MQVCKQIHALLNWGLDEGFSPSSALPSLKNPLAPKRGAGVEVVLKRQNLPLNELRTQVLQPVAMPLHRVLCISRNKSSQGIIAWG